MTARVPTFDDLPEQLRQTLKASLDLDSKETLERDVRSTIEPHRRSDRPALAGAIALLGKLGAGHESLEIRSTLGEGGMGIVHLAHQRALDRDVAVKRVKPEVRSDATTLKLLREAWVTGTLEHPNVVPVYDVRLDADGQPQIVLKKIEGAPWSELMLDDKTVRARFHAASLLEWNLGVLMEVASAIHYAHKRGIVHRDLKPDNVMIGSFGEVYVVDWGLAVALADDGTGRLPLAKDAKELAGTPCYMAPEMLGGSESRISERSDVYLLGAMLFEIATGRPPRDGTNLLAIVAQVVEPVAVPESMPDELARIVRRAMDLDPDARFETAEQFRLAVAGFLAHRGSLELAAQAEARLEELTREAGERTTDGDERRLRLYHLFGECRFGFQQAIRAWEGNERAKAGLAAAIERMIELEMTEGDPRTAAILLAELPEARPSLAARVETAKKARDEEEQRRAALVRDHDPNVGRRTRVFVGVVMATTWTVGPLAAWAAALEWPELDSHLGTIAFTFLLGLFGAGLAYWARDSLSRSVINRSLVGVVTATVTAQLLLFVGAWLGGISNRDAHIVVVLVWALACALVTVTVERRFWPSVVGYVLGFFVQVYEPRARFLVNAVSNGILLVNTVLIWGQIEHDVIEPMQRRAEERHKRWREFLEASRLRE